MKFYKGLLILKMDIFKNVQFQKNHQIYFWFFFHFLKYNIPSLKCKGYINNFIYIIHKTNNTFLN